MSKNLMGLLMVPVLTAGFIVVAFVLMQVSASPEETLLVDASQVEIVSPRPTMSVTGHPYAASRGRFKSGHLSGVRD